ncbi:MAG TPA: hypothetical protein VKR60_02140 [Candidatus Sulfotelmatobacter sp.]|nr:hypothetical protein [Candidatus Sulfotelmatobacter sp.]
MRRKYWPYIGVGVGLYLFVMWSAVRWEKNQHLPDGNIFEHRDHERRKKLAEEQKEEQRKKELEARSAAAAESRLNGGPAFIAVRYDANHVVFMVANDSESRFGRTSSVPQRIAAPANPVAHLAGLEELWETDAGSSRRLPEDVKDTVSGEPWSLSVSADSTVPVTIERAVTAPTGCSLALGFLAVVPENQQAAFAASSEEYFVVRRKPVPAAEAVPGPAVSPAQGLPTAAPTPANAAPPNPARIAPHAAELADWKVPPSFSKQITELLTQRMLEELTRIDASLRANMNSPDVNPDPWLAGNVRTRRKEWLHRDKKLAAGEGQLDYDVRAFRLSPDGVPRLFVRARWKLDGAAVFLMTAWFRAGDLPEAAANQGEARLALLSADSSWSMTLREGRPGDSLGDTLDFQTILNQFDDDHDGWAELLVHSTDGASARFTLELYTDLGLVPTKTSFRRELATPEACMEQR